jgi:hypothetical protein
MSMRSAAASVPAWDISRASQNGMITTYLHQMHILHHLLSVLLLKVEIVHFSRYRLRSRCRRSTLLSRNGGHGEQSGSGRCSRRDGALLAASPTVERRASGLDGGCGRHVGYR